MRELPQLYGCWLPGRPACCTPLSADKPSVLTSVRGARWANNAEKKVHAGARGS